MIKITNAQGLEIPIKFLQFSGGERHVQIEHTGLAMGNVTIRADLLSSNDIMDYLLLENALFKMVPYIKIQLTIPYLPYARQDRVCALGQAFSLEVMAKLLSMREKDILLWDVHSEVSLRLLNATNVSQAQIISMCSELSEELDDENTVLICPDNGAINRCYETQDLFGVKTMLMCEKVRDPMTGQILKTQVHIEGTGMVDLSGKTAIITDDICDGGMTFIGIAKALKELNCPRVVLYVTHGIFSKGLNVFEGLIDQIYTTDSFPQKSQEDVSVYNGNPPQPSTVKLHVIPYGVVNAVLHDTQI